MHELWADAFLANTGHCHIFLDEALATPSTVAQSWLEGSQIADKKINSPRLHRHTNERRLQDSDL